MSKPRAHSFRRTRDDHSMETAADYVELIEELIAETGEARGVDLAARLGVSHVTVSKTVKRLAREGLVVARPYRGIFLTKTWSISNDRRNRRRRDGTPCESRNVKSDSKILAKRVK